MAQTQANRPARPEKLAAALKRNMARRKEAGKQERAASPDSNSEDDAA